VLLFKVFGGCQLAEIAVMLGFGRQREGSPMSPLHFARAWPVLALAGPALATPTFHVTPAPADGDVGTTHDLAWEAAADAASPTLGVARTEFDLDIGDGTVVDTLNTDDGVEIDVSLNGLGGPATTGTIFYGWWAAGGGPLYGAVSGGALEAFEGGVSHSRIVLDFDVPVVGVGTWVFDDNAETENGTTLTVEEVDGTVSISAVLDSGNGLTHRIEGHVGATSDIGIVRAWVDNHDIGDAILAPSECCLLLDHMQVATATTPSDDDADGVLWGTDQCPDTPLGDAVDATGCSLFRTTIEGPCPGATTVTVTGMTPGGQAAIFSGDALGSTDVWAGPCVGTSLGIDSANWVMMVADADGDGAYSFSPIVGGGVCGLHVQFLDVTTCTTTGVATF
jgi:hypothetical protein